ncbi:MAG: ParB/RepB/Spo0J family partition protein [Oscillospiraceae bacterium]
MARKGGLGKGLDVLFEDNNTEFEEASGSIITLRLSDIEPNKEQPRKEFDLEALTELADSIKEHGIIQPLVVRELDDGTYSLVAGERRWRASRMAGLSEVPVIVKELSDKEAMEIALIENLQREDLNTIEEALGYQQLMDKYDMTQEELSKRVGKSRPAIANALRLLNLPDKVIQMVKNDEISAGHARALLRLQEEDTIIETANNIIKKGLSVRDVEKIGKQVNDKLPISQADEYDNSNYCKEAQIILTEILGRKVKIIAGRHKSSLVIDFFSEEDLNYILDRLNFK